VTVADSSCEASGGFCRSCDVTDEINLVSQLIHFVDWSTYVFFFCFFFFFLMKICVVSTQNRFLLKKKNSGYEDFFFKQL
jgi:hypothetical protein